MACISLNSNEKKEAGCIETFYCNIKMLFLNPPCLIYVYTSQNQCEKQLSIFFPFIPSVCMSQGPVELEESPCPGPANSQQPGTRHSFVQEHFQAQYRSDTPFSL